MIAPRLEMDTVRSGYIETGLHLLDHGAETGTGADLRYAELGLTAVVARPDKDAWPVGLKRRLPPSTGAEYALDVLGGRAVVDPHQQDATVYGVHTYDRWRTPSTSPDVNQLEFFRVKGQLELHAYLGPLDFWVEWAPIAFALTQYQIAMAGACGITAGSFVAHISVLTLLERDRHALHLLDPTGIYKILRPTLGYLGAHGATFEPYRERALAYLRGSAIATGWYADRLREIRERADA